MEKSWKVTLSDGTTIENLGLNGNNFISDTEITEDVFTGKLSSVTVEGTDEEGNAVTEEYGRMELIHITKYDDGYYFALRELSQDEIDKEQMQADIEYIAMMSDIDLDEEE